MNSISNIKAIIKRELGGYFSSPVAYVFIVIFLLLMGFFTFMAGGFFERGQATLENSFFMWHPWLYLFLVPAVGMRLWAEERRVGTLELLLTMPITRLAGHRREIPRLVALPVAGLVLDLPGRHHGQLSRLAGERRHFRRLRRQFSHGGRLSGHQLHDLGHDAQPGGQLHPLRRHLPLPGPVRVPPVTNLLTRMDSTWLLNTVTAFSVMTHFEYFTKGVVQQRDVIFYLCVIGFSLFTTGVIIRSHRAG